MSESVQATATELGKGFEIRQLELFLVTRLGPGLIPYLTLLTAS
jgi:hypothetical protein